MLRNQTEIDLNSARQPTGTADPCTERVPCSRADPLGARRLHQAGQMEEDGCE